MTLPETLEQVSRLIRHGVDTKVTGTIDIHLDFSQGAIGNLSVDIIDKKVTTFRYGNNSVGEKKIDNFPKQAYIPE